MGKDMVRFDLRRNEKKATVKRTRCAASSGLVRSRSDLKLRRRMGVMELSDVLPNQEANGVPFWLM